MRVMPSRRVSITHSTRGSFATCSLNAAMARAVIDLLRDREKADRLGRNAAQDMIERFSWNRIVLDVEHIYGVRA